MLANNGTPQKSKNFSIDPRRRKKKKKKFKDQAR